LQGERRKEEAVNRYEWNGKRIRNRSSSKEGEIKIPILNTPMVGGNYSFLGRRRRGSGKYEVDKTSGEKKWVYIL